jgi:hypothetical protein
MCFIGCLHACCRGFIFWDGFHDVSQTRDGRAIEHLVRLTGEAHVGLVYNEGQQELVLYELSVEVLFYESGRS